jgi:hypothetical protein
MGKIPHSPHLTGTLRLNQGKSERNFHRDRFMEGGHIHPRFHFIGFRSSAFPREPCSFRGFFVASEQIGQVQDSSGEITVGPFREIDVNAASKNELRVAVDDDMVVVGGGGIGSVDPGAFLAASFPNDTLTRWIVASTDHTVVDAHRLQAFALGLKIEGMSRQDLFPHIKLVPDHALQANHPQATAQLEQGTVLIGGGFEVRPSSTANVGTASYPEFLRSWRSASKDHVTRSMAGIKSYAIGISEVLRSDVLSSEFRQRRVYSLTDPRNASIFLRALR